MSFPVYPTYKDSGGEWIGAIPDHWSASPLKRAFKIEGGSTPTPDEVNWDGDIAWVTPADLSGLSSLFLDVSKRTITAKGLASCGTTLLPVGSLILSTRAPIGSLAIALISMCTNQGCKGLVPNVNASAVYFAFVLLTAKDELNNRGRGSTFLEISGDELSRFSVPTPPFAEQTQIARFLDHETARIDALIEEQQRLIELLKEKRQTVISHAVTKGLDPTAPMKDSGVEWLGEVPAHWEVSKFGFLKTVLTDYTANGSFADLKSNVTYLDSPNFARLVRLTDLRKNLENLDGVWVDENAYKYLAKSALFGGEFLLANVGAYAGLFYQMPYGAGPASLAPNMFMAKFDEKKILPSFVSFAAIGKSAHDQLRLLATASSAQPKLNKDDFKSVIVALPTLQEQTQIVEFLDIQLSSFDALIAEAESGVSFLQERRSALISAAVTGKIDVRGWKLPARVPRSEFLEEAV